MLNQDQRMTHGNATWIDGTMAMAEDGRIARTIVSFTPILRFVKTVLISLRRIWQVAVVQCQNLRSGTLCAE